MRITQEDLFAFIAEHGPVSVVDTHGKTERLSASSPEGLSLLAKADKVFYGSQWYSRFEFERIIEDQENYSS